MLIRVFYNSDQSRRVAVYRRPDGAYRHAEEARCTTDGDEDWDPLQDPEGSGVYDSEDTAVREACGEVGWLRVQVGKSADPGDCSLEHL